MKRLEPKDQDQLERLFDECAVIPTRLLATQKELWMSWDRLHAEAQFRLSICVPLVFVGLTFTWSDPLIAVAVAVAGLALGLVGQRKEKDATQVLVQAIRTGHAGRLEELPYTWQRAPGTRRRRAAGSASDSGGGGKSGTGRPPR